VQPEYAGNIGFIARLMKNFNFKKLVLFNPKESVENILSHETQGCAMHGKDILINAEIITIDDQENYITEYKKLIKKFDLIIASTAKGRYFRNMKCSAIAPDDLKIPASDKPLNIAIIFGKESRGLTNEEISIADILIRIPASNEYPTLNLSHVCSIILYEIYKKVNLKNLGSSKHPISIADKDDRLLLYKIIQNIIKELKIQSHKEDNIYFAFKNVFERAIITKKELSLITGAFSKVNSILKDQNLYQK
jgi:TrmH family RNA methyltransferase